MKIFISIKTFSLFVLFPCFSFAGEWKRVDKYSIKFSGEITAGDNLNLKKILKKSDKFIFLNSEGGDAEEGLRIANLLLPNKLHVIVDGVCASSCANYLFTAGNIKEIRNGWVGFHGNIVSLYKETTNKIKSLDDFVNIQLPQEKGTMSNQEVLESYSNFSMSLYHVMVADYSYFAKLKINQKFFDLSFKKDKGKGDGNFYEFLLPSAETFTKYGIKNVRGQQKFQQETVSYLDEQNNDINGFKFFYL